MSNPFETAEGYASDCVFVRRAWLDLAGRIPTVEELLAYEKDTSPDKRVRLIDAILETEEYVDYQTMLLADALRVKSEFPVNLWPNAVYVYHRRIRDFVRQDGVWADFARALVTGTGSNFRDAESNFMRATAERTPAGFTTVALRTFLGKEYAALPEQEQTRYRAYFENVKVKTTREWKEEIVYTEGPDRRGEFADMMLGPERDTFDAAFSGRVAARLFGKGTLKTPPPDHIAAFRAGGGRLKPLLRALTLSEAYRAGPITGGFPLRRLEAEVLEDVLRAITHTERNYSSIAPEPFTFIPGDRRTTALEDGSISNAFLLLFGRPARDTGLPEERDDRVTVKQRLYLLNSGKVYAALASLTDGKSFRKKKIEEQIRMIYQTILSRAPTEDETKMLVKHRRKLKNVEFWRFQRDLAWGLVNSKEFMFRH